MDGSALKTYRAVVVGLGKIGFSIDQHLPRADFVLSHTSALLNHPQFDLLAGVDPLSSHRAAFEKATGLPSFEDLQALSQKFKNSKIDLIVLAVPSENHRQIFEDCLKLKPQMILVEKPLALDLRDAEAMVAAAQSVGVKVAVNYIRRFEPAAIQIKEKLESQVLGKIQKIVVWYSKGLFNNASHFLDLMDFWLLKETEGSHGIQVLESRKSFSMPGDWEPDFRIMFGSTPVYFLALEEEFYSAREIEIYAEQGAIFYHRGGLDIEYRGVSENSVFKGYKFLDPQGKSISSDLQRYQHHVVSALADCLHADRPAVSSGNSALKTMAVVEKVRELCLKTV